MMHLLVSFGRLITNNLSYAIRNFTQFHTNFTLIFTQLEIGALIYQGLISQYPSTAIKTNVHTLASK